VTRSVQFSVAKRIVILVATGFVQFSVAKRIVILVATRFVQFSVATRIVILVETKIVQFYVATRFVQFSIIWRICIKQSGGSFSFITSWQCSDKIRKYQGHIETFGRRKKIKILMRFPEIKTKNLFYY